MNNGSELSRTSICHLHFSHFDFKVMITWNRNGKPSHFIPSCSIKIKHQVLSRIIATILGKK